jgi:thioredoxin 1
MLKYCLVSPGNSNLDYIMPALIHDPKLFELKQLIQTGNAVIIDFSATWCGPCKMIGPVFEELSKAHQNVHFVKVDVDQRSDIAAEYNITAMPTFIAFKNGSEVNRSLGADKTRLQSIVASL